jgi:hypothetical protein
MIVLAGCANEWRSLTIDGSSESAFGDSVEVLSSQLSSTRSMYLAIALDDIARTGAQTFVSAEGGNSRYTDEDFRAELGGLTYEGVIELADQTGTPVRRQIRNWSGPVAPFGDEPFYDPTGGRPAFTIDGRPMRDIRPHGRDWPTGADNNGNAVYGNR